MTTLYNVTQLAPRHVCPTDDSLPFYRRTACIRDTPATYTAAQAKAVGITADRWPYGPNICQHSSNLLVAWALAEGLKLADPRARCLHWIVGEARRCTRLQTHGSSGRVDTSPRTLDHPTFWTRDGAPALLLAQPYAPPTFEWISQTMTDWAVEVEVLPESPWYGYGTYGVLITPREA